MPTEIEYGLMFDGDEDYFGSYGDYGGHPWRRWHILKRDEPELRGERYEGGYWPICGTKLTTDSFLVESEIPEDGVLCRKCEKLMEKRDE